jgi:hypothetical protein
MIHNVLHWIKGLFGRSARKSQLPIDNWELLPFSFEIDWYVGIRKGPNAVIPRKEYDVARIREEPPDNYGGTG